MKLQGPKASVSLSHPILSTQVSRSSSPKPSLSGSSAQAAHPCRIQGAPSQRPALAAVPAPELSGRAAPPAAAAAKVASNSSRCLAAPCQPNNLWGREEQSTAVSTHSPIIIPCLTSGIIYLDTQHHAASCDHSELAVLFMENFAFPLPKYF